MFVNLFCLFCGGEFGKFIADEQSKYTLFTCGFNIKP